MVLKFQCLVKIPRLIKTSFLKPPIQFIHSNNQLHTHVSIHSSGARRWLVGPFRTVRPNGTGVIRAMRSTGGAVIPSRAHLARRPIRRVAVVTRRTHGARNRKVVANAWVSLGLVAKGTGQGHVATLRAVLGEDTQDGCAGGIRTVVAWPADGGIAGGAVTVVAWATVDFQGGSCRAFVRLPAWNTLWKCSERCQ